MKTIAFIKTNRSGKKKGNLLRKAGKVSPPDDVEITASGRTWEAV